MSRRHSAAGLGADKVCCSQDLAEHALASQPRGLPRASVLLHAGLHAHALELRGLRLPAQSRRTHAGTHSTAAALQCLPVKICTHSASSLVCTGAGAGAAISRERLTAADLGAGTDALAFLGAHFAHDSRPGPRTRQPARIGFASAVAVRHRWNVRPFRVKHLRGCDSRRALTWLVCRQEQRGTNGGGLSARLARRGAVRHQRYPRRQPAAAAAGAGIGHGALPSLRAR